MPVTAFLGSNLKSKATTFNLLVEMVPELLSLHMLHGGGNKSRSVVHSFYAQSTLAKRLGRKQPEGLGSEALHHLAEALALALEVVLVDCGVVEEDDDENDHHHVFAVVMKKAWTKGMGMLIKAMQATHFPPLAHPSFFMSSVMTLTLSSK